MRARSADSAAVPPPPRSTGRSTARNPASAVYGTVLAGALIAAEGSHDPVRIGSLVAIVLVTQGVYWLAHVYAELVAARISTGSRPRMAELRDILDHEWPLVAASFGPLAVIGAASLLGVAADTAVIIGLWANTAELAGWALVTGRRGHMRGAELALYVALSLAFGGVLIVVKATLH